MIQGGDQYGDHVIFAERETRASRRDAFGQAFVIDIPYSNAFQTYIG